MGGARFGWGICIWEGGGWEVITPSNCDVNGDREGGKGVMGGGSDGKTPDHNPNPNPNLSSNRNRNPNPNFSFSPGARDQKEKGVR